MRRILQAIGSLAATSVCIGAAQARDAEPQFFAVELNRSTTAPDPIQQIIDAGRPEIAESCASNPTATVRVFSPIASGAYSDVSCASILEAAAATPSNENEERIGEARGALGPITFLMCGIFAAGSTLFMTYGICPHARNPRDRRNCEHVSNFGSAAMTIMCAIPF
jgi:hypothetical protein